MTRSAPAEHRALQRRGRGARTTPWPGPAPSRGMYCAPMPTTMARITPVVIERRGIEPVRRVDEAAEELGRLLERLCPEEHPGEAHDVERDRPAARRAAASVSGGSGRPRRFATRPAEVLDAEERAVDRAPHHERPGGAVPQAAEEHREHEISSTSAGCRCGCRRAGCRGSRAATATASCASAARSPGSTSRCTGCRSSAGSGSRAAARADRHVGVAAEVGVDLDRVRVDARPARQRRSAACGEREDRVDDLRREEVGDHDLLEQPDEDQEERAARVDRAADRGAASSCGMNSAGRTIGPATTCGKNDRNTAKSSRRPGSNVPR